MLFLQNLLRRWLRNPLLAVVALSMLVGCGSEWNDPYPAMERGSNRLYTSFSERPKHLDPAIAYSSNEIGFISQIYEPPLQYHYLERPYTLMPSTLVTMPEIRFTTVPGRRSASLHPSNRWHELSTA